MIMWTHDDIFVNLKKIIQDNDLKTFPTASMIVKITGDYRLTNAITRNGRFEYWRNLFNMQSTPSDTLVGWCAEDFILKELKDYGFEVFSTRDNPKCEYDLLVNSNRCDVKFSKINEKYNTYSFRLSKREPTCDYYILVCDKMIWTIPSVNLKQVQVTISNTERGFSRFKDYENNFESLK